MKSTHDRGIICIARSQRNPTKSAATEAHKVRRRDVGAVSALPLPGARLASSPRSSVDRAAVSYTAAAAPSRDPLIHTRRACPGTFRGLLESPLTDPHRRPLFTMKVRITRRALSHFQQTATLLVTSLYTRGENVQLRGIPASVANRSLGVLLLDAVLGADRRRRALALDGGWQPADIELSLPVLRAHKRRPAKHGRPSPGVRTARALARRTAGNRSRAAAPRDPARLRCATWNAPAFVDT
jgi:hypothetical protein